MQVQRQLIPEETVPVSVTNSTDGAVEPHIRRSMISNRGRDNRLEVGVRSSLHRAGLRFRKHRSIPGLRGTIDIAFPRQMLAVFLDGCFWHQCPDHRSMPQRNREWWASKLHANVERDERANEALERQGWRVLRLWEHLAIDEMVIEIEQALQDTPAWRAASRRASSPALKNYVQDIA